MGMMTIYARPLILFGLILIAAALRLHNLDAQSVWFDEGYSWNAAVSATIVDAANADATNPPLYYALLHGFVRFAGDSEFSLRLFSLLLALPLIPLADILARRFAPPRRRQWAGLSAALFATLLPALMWASQEARMYTLLALLVMIAALAWHRLNRRPSRAAWLALWLAELALLYAHNSGVVIVLWLNLVTLLAWIAARSMCRPMWSTWISGQLAIGALWLPYFVTRFLDVTTANSAITAAPALTLDYMLEVWLSFWVIPYERISDPFNSVGIIVLVSLIGAGLIALLLTRARWLLAHIAILLLALTAALIILGNEYHGRYVVMIAPLVAVALGVGIACLPRIASRYSVVIVSGLCIVLTISSWDDTMPYRHDDARDMVRYYAKTLDAADTMLAWSYADRYDLAYYWDRFDSRARRVTLPEGADIETIAPLLPAAGDVALNIWYTQRADYRGMIGCLLEHGTTAPPETYTTYGMTTNVYRQSMTEGIAAQPVTWTIADERGEIGRLETISIPDNALVADQALCLPIAMTLTRPVDIALKATLIVRNPLGDEIASADAILATADQRTSESVAAGEILRGFPLVRLPYGAPAVEYTLELRIYDETRRVYGYDLIDGDTRTLDRRIAVWNPRPATTWNMPPPGASALASIDGLTLMTVNAPMSARPGDHITLTLGWMTAGGYVLDWRALRIPIETPPGDLPVQLADGQGIVTLTVEDVPFVNTAPPVAQSVNAAVDTVGVLVGLTMDEFSLGTAPRVELVWRASAPSLVSYTTFIQLLDVDGSVIAQSDHIPVQGSRPTTGWRVGEFIVDNHTLTWNALARPGTASLIVGMYDAATGMRLRFDNGEDRVVVGQVEVR